MTILRVTQPYRATWITLFKPYVILQKPKDFEQYVCRSRKNVCRSQNTMKFFFLFYQQIAYVFWLVSPAVLVIIDNSSNFQDFLFFLMCIQACLSLNIYFLMFPLTYMLFFILTNFRSRTEPMQAFFQKKNSVKYLRYGKNRDF